MPTDYYGDGDTEPTSNQPESQPAEDKDPGDEKTALVPSSLCPDMKPGDTLTLKIVAVHDGEYEVSYSPESGDDETAESEQPSMSRASEQNRSMYME